MYILTKREEVAILIADKIDFMLKLCRDKECHNIMTKELINEEYGTTANIYAPAVGAPRYIKQILY